MPRTSRPTSTRTTTQPRVGTARSRKTTIKESAQPVEAEVVESEGQDSYNSSTARYDISPNQIKVDGQQYAVESYSEIAFDSISTVYGLLVRKRSIPDHKVINNALHYIKRTVLPDLPDTYIWVSPGDFYDFKMSLAHLMALMLTLWHWYVIYKLDQDQRENIFKDGPVGAASPERIVMEYREIISRLEKLDYRSIVVPESEVLAELKSASGEVE